MRIALVKRRYSLKVGGAERYCVNLARRLTAFGHEVTFIGESIDPELSHEVGFVPVKVNRLTSWTKNRSFAENTGRAAREGRFDVVYGLGRAFGLDAVRITDRLQSHWLNVYYRNAAYRTLQRLNPRHRTMIELERTILHSSNVRRIVTQSRLDRQLVRDYYNVPEEKIRTIFNGVDTSVFHPGVRVERLRVREELGIEPNRPFLVFASMDFHGKGLRSILRAFQISRIARVARLAVVGKGSINRFRRMADSLGVGQSILFVGHRTDIHRFYGAADMSLMPTTYEPFPNVNLESLACGTPALTTATAGGADLIEDGKTGYLVSNVHAIGEIAERLDAHFSLSSAERSRISDACWNKASQMTVERNAQKTVELFEEVLHEKFRV
jgi:UDP-glucose:(heptosyl)LPS alpha-1,3-glucosyltransferase